MNTVYLMLLLISAATLAFQMALTRFFALAQGSHLAFMAVSMALLGAGASGTYLSLKPPTKVDLRSTITIAAALFTLSVPASYLAINYLPFDAYRLAWERMQLLWLVLYYLALTVPFFFSGIVIGAVLAVQPDQAGPIYAANLLGSGLGPPLALLALAIVGGPGTVFFCTLLGWMAMASSRWPAVKNRARSGFKALQVIFFFTASITLFYFAFYPPAIFDVRLTPYKALSQAKLYPGSEIVFSRWNAFSRVDVIRSDGIRSAPGLSFTYAGELPPQLGLTVDGDNLVPITNPTQPLFTRYLPLSLGFELRPRADVLILEPGGALAVLAALPYEPRSVTVIQNNHTVTNAIEHEFADFSGNIYSDPRVEVIVDESRSYLRRTNRQFDLIILPLSDSFRPVTAGAYTLNEDYRYTVEAFSDAMAHLSKDGLLVAERWVQMPPSESLRLWGTAIEALRSNASCSREQASCRDLLAQRLMAMRSIQTALVIVANSPFSPQDLAKVRQFTSQLQFDLIWLPGIQLEEANRYSIVPGNPYYYAFADLLSTPEPETFYAGYAYAVAPPTDDHPFFFHFFKWQQTPDILQTLGKTWQPFGGSGYLMLVLLLILVIILSTALILLPLVVMKVSRSAAQQGSVGATSPPLRRTPAPLLVRFLLYFSLLGFGFLFVEIPLLQQFILYLGQPAHAFAMVVSALLVAAGLGSRYLSGRLPLRITTFLIAFLAVMYPWVLSTLFAETLQLPFSGRTVVTIVAVMPLGILLGVPFPRGLMLVGRTAPALTPWVWAVNGCASVISAVLASMVALTWGFSAVLWGAAGAYMLAGIMMRDTLQPTPSQQKLESDPQERPQVVA